MTSCARCWTHLGWSFGALHSSVRVEVKEGGEPREKMEEPFLGLVLTYLRERRVDATDLCVMKDLVEETIARLEEVEDTMESMEGSSLEIVDVNEMGEEEGEEDESGLGEVMEAGGTSPRAPMF